MHVVILSFLSIRSMWMKPEAIDQSFPQSYEHLTVLKVRDNRVQVGMSALIYF